MGLISKLLGRSGDYFDERATTLVNAAQIQATSSYVLLLNRFQVLETTPTERWDFFVTVVGVFIAASRLNDRCLPDVRANHLMEKVASDLDEWNREGIRAFDDCKALFEREHDRLTARGHDVHFIATDALGLWVVLNVLGKRPTTDEEIGLVRAVGVLITHAFFNW